MTVNRYAEALAAGHYWQIEVCHGCACAFVNRDYSAYAFDPEMEQRVSDGWARFERGGNDVTPGVHKHLDECADPDGDGHGCTCAQRPGGERCPVCDEIDSGTTMEVFIVVYGVRD